MEGRRTEQKQFKVPALLWRETAWGGWVSGVTDSMERDWQDWTARPDTLQWAAGKGSLPEEPTGKPEASAQAERGQLLLEGALGGCHPGQPGSLPEGQVVVVPLPPGEGVALPPPPQIGFHAYPELVWHSTAGPLHPPGCTEPPLNTPACWALPLPGSPPSPTLPPLASSCPLYGCGGVERLS